MDPSTLTWNNFRPIKKWLLTGSLPSTPNQELKQALYRVVKKRLTPSPVSSLLQGGYGSRWTASRPPTFFWGWTASTHGSGHCRVDGRPPASTHLFSRRVDAVLPLLFFHLNPPPPRSWRSWGGLVVRDRSLSVHPLLFLHLQHCL